MRRLSRKMLSGWTFWLIAALLVSGLTLGCQEEQGPMEEAGEKIDEAVGETKDAIEDVGDEMAGEGESLGEQMEEAAEEAGEAMEEMGEEVEEAVEGGGGG